MGDGGSALHQAQAVERLVLTAKGAKGAACVAVLQQALSSPHVHVFGELLELESVQKLAGGAHAPQLQLLRIFAHGTCQDYQQAPGLPDLAPEQLTKLRLLTICSLASDRKV